MFKMTRKYRKRTPRKKLEDKLDKKWSEIILSKGKCEVSGSQESLNPHHIVGRRNRRLRWDLRNGCCLNSGYHVLRSQSAHQDSIWFMKWLDENRPRDKEYLERVEHEIVKWTMDSLQAKYEQLCAMTD